MIFNFIKSEYIYFNRGTLHGYLDRLSVCTHFINKTRHKANTIWGDLKFNAVEN